MGEAQGTGEKESSGPFGRIVEYLKHHPPLLFGLGAGMLLLASAKPDYRPVTVPLMILFVVVMVVWLAAERIKQGTFSFWQGRTGITESSSIGQGHAPGRRVVRNAGASRVPTSTTSDPRTPPERPVTGGTRPQISVFVGREDVLDAVAGQLAGGVNDASNRSYLVDATGPWGIGKTALLEKIKLDHGARYLAVRGDLGQFTPESAPGPASQLSTRQLQCNFDQFCALLIALAEAAGSAAFDGFRTKVEREWARIADAVDRVDMRVDMMVVARRGSEITGSEVANVPDPADTVIRATIAAVRPAVAGQALGAASATARSVLLLDEYDRLSGHPIADWVLELARGPRTTVVVVTTKSDCPELAGDVSRHPLPRFEDNQVGCYLDQVAAALSEHTGRPVTLPPSVAEELFRVSQGYPQLVGVAPT